MMIQLRSVEAAPIEQHYRHLQDILRECGSVVIGYSGGVDSVFLAHAAVATLGAGNVLAVTGLSPSYPEVQRAVARDCAARFGIPHLEVDTHELSDPAYAENPSNRCYYCKSELWPRLRRVAAERGLAAVLDGSNADDSSDHRPGAAAARENGVRSPLQEAGLTKAQVRELSRRAGLPTWDQPAAPCLASRLPYGVAVTPARLREVELAEAALRELGLVEFRVRHHDDCLRIEVAPRELERAATLAGRMLARLRALRLPRALLDAEGYRRGALNEGLVQLGPSAQPPTGVNELPAHDVVGFHGDIAVPSTPALEDARAAGPALRRAGFRYIALDLARLAEAGHTIRQRAGV